MTIIERIGWLERELRKLRSRTTIVEHAHTHEPDGDDPIDVAELDLDGQLEIEVDGFGAVITTGAKKRYARVPWDFTLEGWEIAGSPSGSIVFDVWKAPYADIHPTVADTVIGGGGTKPTVSGAIKATSANVTDYTTEWLKGEYIEINVDSVSGFTKVNLFLYGKKRS